MLVVESVRDRNEFFIPAILARLVATNQQNGAVARVKRKEHAIGSARMLTPKFLHVRVPRNESDRHAAAEGLVRVSGVGSLSRSHRLVHLRTGSFTSLRTRWCHALRNIAAFASRAYMASDRRITPERSYTEVMPANPTAPLLRLTTIRQVNAYSPPRPITGQCWMNIRLMHTGMASALDVRFDFSDRKTSAPGTNSPKLPCSPPAPPPFLACQRARIPLIARQNTCDLLRGYR